MRKLKSELVRTGDRNLQIIKRLAEAIQDAGGIPDVDLLHLAYSDSLMAKVGAVAVSGLFEVIGQVSLPRTETLLEEIILNLRLTTDAETAWRRHQEIAENWVNNGTKVCQKLPGHDYRIIHPVRRFQFPEVKELMARYGFEVAWPEELVGCIPSIREFIRQKRSPVWFARFVSADSARDAGVIFQSQYEPDRPDKPAWLAEELYTWQDKHDVSTGGTDYILVKPPQAKT